MAEADRSAAEPTNALRLPAVAFIVVYCILLLCIPSRLIVSQVGAAGTPATLWGLCALIWWTCATVGGRNPRGWSPVRIAAGLLTIAVLVSYAASMTHGWYAPPDVRQSTDMLYDLTPVTLDELTSKMITAADRGLLSFGGWMGILLLTVDGLRSWRDLELLVTWLTWLGAGVASLGIIQFFTGFDIASVFEIPGLVANSDFGAVDTRSILRRVSSTAIHPIEFGVVMAGIFPLALHRTIFDWHSKLMWVPTILIGVAVPMSVSRSAMLAIGLAFIIMFVAWPASWRKRALLIAPASAVVMRLMVPGLVGTIVSLFTNFFTDPSITGRTSDYSVVFRVFGDHPWLGRGLFTFVPRYYRILDNQFLLAMLELGIIGLLVVLMFFLVAFFTARGARRRVDDLRKRNLALSISACIGGVVVSYVTFDAWGFPMAAGLTFLLVGMSGAAWQLAARGETGGPDATTATPPRNPRLPQPLEETHVQS